MTDRELLELAAKAAGYGVDWREWVTSRIAEFGTIKYTKQSGFWLDGKQWNPLTDDGDALRLAVKLGIHLQFAMDYAVSYAGSVHAKQFTERDGDDPYAAARRAIVRAAAAIGQSMS